jgi:hypothetical protein
MEEPVVEEPAVEGLAARGGELGHKWGSLSDLLTLQFSPFNFYY